LNDIDVRRSAQLGLLLKKQKMPSFSKLFKSRNHSSKKNAKPITNGIATPVKPQWSDAWIRTRVDTEEVVELLSGCTRELKSRGRLLVFMNAHGRN
jgi:hypothetical protein